MSIYFSYFLNIKEKSLFKFFKRKEFEKLQIKAWKKVHKNDSDIERDTTFSPKKIGQKHYVVGRYKEYELKELYNIKSMKSFKSAKNKIKKQLKELES